MKLIVGLGNPGSDYQNTRHNAGWMVIDRLARRHAGSERVRARFHADTLDCQVAGHRALLIKPTTFMNRSGLSVSEAVGFFKLDPAMDMLVVVDETALAVGELRLRASGGENGHNGLKDIRARIGSDIYPRLRVGVGSPHPGENKSSYVLGRFREDERLAIDAAINKAADACEAWNAKGIDAAMNTFNTRISEQTNKAEPAKPAPPKPEQAKQDGSSDTIDPGWLAG